MNLFASRLFGVIATLIVLLLLAVSIQSAMAHDHIACTEQEVAPLGQSIDGKSKLCVMHDGIRGSMKADGLTQGDAYTLWIVYIDDPTVCDPATLDCFDDADPEGVFGRFDSAVGTTQGKHMFTGKVNGMVPSSGSLVFLLLYTHGPADYSDGRKLARQLLTPEDPDAGAPHLGNFVDGPGFVPAAISIFAVP